MWLSVLSVLLFLSLFQVITADTECPLAPTSYGDRRTNKNTLRLVQYNVEWLYIDHYSQFDCPGSQCTWKNLTEAETHMSYVKNVVADLQPDIINFCEVEGCDELNILIDELDDKTYLPYLKQGADTSTGQNVGLITRVDPLVSLYRNENRIAYPVAGSKCGYTGEPSTSGVSKHYITEFKLGTMHVALIAAHLIAYPTDASRCAQREAQAMVLQSVILGYINRDYEVIMMGDFNDFDGSVLDVNSNKPTSMVLDILKGMNQNKSLYTLHSIAETIPQDQRYSDWYDSDSNCATASSKDYSTIDHVLVTPALQQNIVNTFIYHGYKEFCGKYDSDHFPVVIDFLF